MRPSTTTSSSKRRGAAVHRRAGIGGACLLAVFGAAQAQGVVCPPELQSDETLRGEAPAGWQLAQQVRVTARRLEGVGLYSGHPDEMAALVPDQAVRKAQRLVSTWRLADTGVEAYWLACTYSNSKLQFVRPVSAGTKQCVLTQRLNKAGAAVAVESLDCR
ncbi:MAG: STY0301 family protein [Inhella sp.]